MKKRSLTFLVLAACALPLLAEGPDPAAFDKKFGGALLDGIVRVFHDIAATGSRSDLKKIEDFLVSSMGEARKAREAKQIDAVFFARYRRLLGIVKLTMAPDPGGILAPMLDQVLNGFVTEILGEEYKGIGAGAIHQVANAIADEIINLKLYMDNVEIKARLRKEFDERLGEAALDKKK